MPIQDKDLGKYNRPGIFINEIDASIIELPVQDVLINLVPGFSKKGPINRPVYVTNKVDFIRMFGDIDRSLERKGSYFHRTCIKMMKSGPIWALNLLSTDDTRDTVSWKSIATGAAYTNASTRSMPYSRLFNRQDFWERDDESFLDYVNDPTVDTDRLLHITNLGEKTITVFMYKSSLTGFDVTAEDWYEGQTKVPAFLHYKDWISDYNVSVLIIEGDWTNYDVLSVDTTWGSYFTSTGLDKTLIQDFVDETNVTTLAFYEASLIPYFKDNGGREMYIKALINNNTDKTGLFCSYYEDTLLDSDTPTGRLDLIGDGIVGSESSTIDFLSYNETIVESLTYNNTPLDNYNNVFGNYSSALGTDTFNSISDSRSASGTNHYVHEARIATTRFTGSTMYKVFDIASMTGKTFIRLATTWGTPEYIDPQNTTYTNYHQYFSTGTEGGTTTSVGINAVVYFNKAYGGLSANTAYYIEDVTDGGRAWTVSSTPGGDALVVTTGTAPADWYITRTEINLENLTSAYFVLDGVRYSFDTGTTEYVFEPLEYETPTNGYERYDTLYLSKGDLATVNILKGAQSSTNGASLPSFTLDYTENIILGYVKLSVESGATPATATTNFYQTIDYTPITLDKTNGYVPLTSIIASGITIGTTNYVRLSFDFTSGTTEYDNYNKLRYRNAYDEIESYLDDSQGVIIKHTTGEKYYIENALFSDYSTTSNAYIRIPVGSTTATDYFMSGDTSQWLVYYVDNEFYIGSTNVNRVFSSTLPFDLLTSSGVSGAGAGVMGKYSQIYLDYYNGIVNNEDYGRINNLSASTDTQIYLKMWIEGTDTLYLDFLGEDKLSPYTLLGWTANYNDQFIVWSNISNYKQTIEIESLDTTKLATNLVYEIKVDKVRYSELKKGDFLEAYYDTAAYESGGALFGTDPKKLTRIIAVSIDTTNTDWKVLQTDTPIKITTNTQTDDTADYATTTYPQIEEYVSTYKGISLNPFTIHADSIPNNTEARQDSILDVIGKTTNLTKGLVNKNKISWRYLVDSFGLGLASASKQQYTDMCGLKLNCLGFVNAPSVKTLKNSSNPAFINDDDRTLSTTFLKAGGDESKNPSFLYSFSEGAGRATVGYFFPYVTVDDLGIPKNVPPAAWVATTYMKKHLTTQSSIEPWTIAAGISNGRVTDIAGVEMDFTDEDLTNLFAMGLNPIVKKRNAGYCINSESTAQVFPQSSLSLIHARELLIELENALYDMLLRYQWRFNTPEIRAEIKFRADRICKDLQDRDGLYSFKNVIDKTNNTNYIIDLQMGVLDTFIEIVKGMGTIVNNITILKKGDIESGGFQ